MEAKERIISLRILSKIKKNLDYEKYFDRNPKRTEEHYHKKRKDNE